MLTENFNSGDKGYHHRSLCPSRPRLTSHIETPSM